MGQTLKLPELIGPKVSAYCPGCGHTIFQRVLAEVFQEMGYQSKSILFTAIGCTCNMAKAWMGCRQGCPHGRPASYATGATRVLQTGGEDILICTYQGDGDAYCIGYSETHNAAYRGEKMTAFIVNNANFGMTGGQMGATSLEGQITKTSLTGRDVRTTGHPYHFPEMVAEFFPNVAYAARGALNNPKNIKDVKKYVRKALETQLAGGYSVVEVLGMCPTNWKIQPLDALDFVDKMIKEFPLGEFKKA